MSDPYEALEAQLTQAFRAGQLGQAALITWEIVACYPRQPVGEMYRRKLLRIPALAEMTEQTLLENGRKAYFDEMYGAAAEVAAFGLLRSPKNRTFGLMLAEVADRLDRLDWVPLVLRALGEPKDDDLVLLNAHAAYEHQCGNYETANNYFKQLYKAQPANEEIVNNLSASLVGLERYEEAIDLLQQHLPKANDANEMLRRLVQLYGMIGLDTAQRLRDLDESFFQACSTVAHAATHAVIHIWLQNATEIIRGREVQLAIEWDNEVAFQLAEAQYLAGDYERAHRNYQYRMAAFPKLRYFEPAAPEYAGEILENETLFIWNEQGIGEELLFSYFFDEVAARVKNVTVAMDERLIPYFRTRYPSWNFFHRLDKHLMPSTDYAISAGELMRLFLDDLLVKGGLKNWPLITVPIVDSLSGEDHKQKKKIRVGISWRGGSGTDGKIRSIQLSEFLQGLPESKDIELISFQYDGDFNEGENDSDSRVLETDFDNKKDLEKLFRAMSECDAIMTVDNANAHLATAVGLPTYVVVPAGQIQFRWKNRALKELFFKSAKVFVQHEPGLWDRAVCDAWRTLLEDLA